MESSYVCTMLSKGNELASMAIANMGNCSYISQFYWSVLSCHVGPTWLIQDNCILMHFFTFFFWYWELLLNQTLVIISTHIECKLTMLLAAIFYSSVIRERNLYWIHRCQWTKRMTTGCTYGIFFIRGICVIVECKVVKVNFQPSWLLIAVGESWPLLFLCHLLDLELHKTISQLENCVLNRELVLSIK